MSIEKRNNNNKNCDTFKCGKEGDSQEKSNVKELKKCGGGPRGVKSLLVK